MKNIQAIKLQIQCGFSLVEVMISVLVLSLGLLGLASLQLSSLRYQQESHDRSIAISQINEIADRMRANPVGINNGNYNNVSGIPSKPSCTTCTSTQVAAIDINTWNTENFVLLPSGQGRIQSLGSKVFDITIFWDMHRTGSTGTACSGNPNIDLSCVTVRVEM